MSLTILAAWARHSLHPAGSTASLEYCIGWHYRARRSCSFKMRTTFLYSSRKSWSKQAKLAWFQAPELILLSLFLRPDAHAAQHHCGFCSLPAYCGIKASETSLKQFVD